MNPRRSKDLKVACDVCRAGVGKDCRPVRNDRKQDKGGKLPKVGRQMVHFGRRLKSLLAGHK